MKLKWSLAVVVAFLLGALIAYYFSQPSNKEKLLNLIPNTLLLQPSEHKAELADPVEMTFKPTEQIQEMKAAKKVVNKNTPKKAAELKPQTESKVHKELDLSLPKDWDNHEYKNVDQAKGPDYFKPKEVKKFNLSTKLHWDESEEARSMPIEKTIEGAELELQFRLP